MVKRSVPYQARATSSSPTVNPYLFAAFLALLLAVMASPAVAQPGGATEVQSENVHTSLENLRAFAKLYGYVRYFHPSDEASEVDWEHFVLYGVQEVKDAANPEALKEKLETLFLPIAPTVQLYNATDAPPPPSPLLTPEDTTGLELVAWQHRGVGLGNPGPYESARLHRSRAVPGMSDFGTVVQSLDAAPYRGQEVKLEAAVRAVVSGGGNGAQLWLRVDRPDQQTGFFDNMQDRPITAAEWSTYTLVGTVTEDAERIVFGGFLRGAGEAWFDDVQLSVRESAEDAWTPVPLENSGFELGEANEPPSGWLTGAPDYHFEAVMGAAYEGAKALLIASTEPNRVTGTLFGPHPAAGEVVEKVLGRGLATQIPLALYSRDSHTLRPEDTVSPDALMAALQSINPAELTAQDEALRYADVIIAWNIFQHFYPYFDVVEVDWDKVLTETLRRAGGDHNAKDFLQTLRWMVAQLDDGHGRVQHPLEQEEANLPFLVDEVEGEVVIIAVAAKTEADEEKPCFERGDVVASLDGVPAADVLREAEVYISGSPQWKTYRALSEFGFDERGSLAHLTLNRSDETVTCEVTRTSDAAPQEARPAPITELEKGVYYVDLSRAEMNDIAAQAPTLATAKGVVFDLRGYPNNTHDALRYLTQKPVRSAIWEVPEIIYPDRQNLVGYDTSGRWTLLPKKPHFTGKIVFLTEARAISYAESVMGIVENYKLGEIVGQPTAGANGNVNSFTLPGGYTVRWTGMRVVKHDGSKHHLVGIQPTVPTTRTLEGVREGKDELLERALALIEAAP